MKMEKQSSNLNKYSFFITIAILVCYFRCLFGDFVFDDSEAIVNNEDVKGNKSIIEIFNDDFWGTNIKHKSSHKSYRPFTVLVFRFLVYLTKQLSSEQSGLNPKIFHSLNLIIYLTECLYLMKIVKSLLKGTKQVNESSFFITLLFAVHPIHSEVVCICK